MHESTELLLIKILKNEPNNRLCRVCYKKVRKTEEEKFECYLLYFLNMCP